MQALVRFANIGASNQATIEQASIGRKEKSIRD
jgi:hypothetical protein